MAGIKKVMISSTAFDLPKHREQAKEACLGVEMLPVMMENLPASDEEAVSASINMVDKADIYLLILAYRYGYVPTEHNPKQISLTEMEYDRAVERKIPRIVFVMHDDHPLRAADVEKGDGALKLEAFKNRVGIERVNDKFKSPEDLSGKVIHALMVYRESNPSASHVNHEIVSATQASDILSTDLVVQSYADACEGEELFIDFCNDVSEKGDFLKNISISLRKGLVAQDKAQRIIVNLSSVFRREHLRLLFELICLIYDEIPTSDEVIRRMVNRGLSKSDIVEATHFMPKTASMNFCRRVFDAFYNQGIDPLRFESALFSPRFVDYCLHLDFDRTREIIEGWKKKFDTDYLISDAVACILYMIDNAGDENTKHKVSGLLRSWRKKGVLDNFMKSDDYQVSKVRQATW